MTEETTSSNMATTPADDTMVDGEVSPQVFSDLSKLEKEFANVELDALRRKEFNLLPLYKRRTQILRSIPSFWPTVLLNGPQEFQSILDLESPDSIDLATISAITSFQVERYSIQSETHGEPRSLRFVFEFAKNDIFEDERVVKEFEFVEGHSGEDDDDDRDGMGALISKPVGLKWTKKGKKMAQKCGGLLDLACQLHQAEEAAKMNVKGAKGGKGEEIDMVEREGLWQYEKLRERLEKIEDGELEVAGCWLDWFGYRGPVDIGKPSVTKNGDKISNRKDKLNHNHKPKSNSNYNGQGIKSADEDEDSFEGFNDRNDSEDDDDDEEDSGLLDVEIFPSGEEVAIALAEDLWPNVMDYFMASREADEDEDDDDDHAMEYDDDDESDEEVPALIAADDADSVDAGGARPNKKARVT